jgi:Spy/CpxP family protein refolding chaperone
MRNLALQLCFVLSFTAAYGFGQKVEAGQDDIKREELKKWLGEAKWFPRAVSPADTVSPLTALQGIVKGTFWRNPEWIKLLDLAEDQQKKMDEIFYQHRLSLVTLVASLQKEELVLEPLLVQGRVTSDETKILAQIDRIAAARAELEKANSRMLLQILQVLTPDQWSKLPSAPGKPGFKLVKPK